MNLRCANRKKPSWCCHTSISMTTTVVFLPSTCAALQYLCNQGPMSTTMGWNWLCIPLMIRHVCQAHDSIVGRIDRSIDQSIDRHRDYSRSTNDTRVKVGWLEKKSQRQTLLCRRAHDMHGRECVHAQTNQLSATGTTAVR